MVCCNIVCALPLLFFGCGVMMPMMMVHLMCGTLLFVYWWVVNLYSGGGAMYKCVLVVVRHLRDGGGDDSEMTGAFEQF